MKPPRSPGPPDRAAREAVLGKAQPAGVIDVHSDLSQGQFGRYEVVASIGRGGMGEVYLARRRNKSAARLVALKVLVADAYGDDDLVAMFIDEASIMAQIHHPNVLEVFDFGREDNRYYLAMEYLAGRPLVRVMIDAYSKIQGLDPILVAAIGGQAARGLHAAHTATGKSGQPLQVVHRDVSPQNLFVTYGGVCKVLDFGVARAAERMAQTTVGQLKGKAAYMSPEQVQGGIVDRRSDVFSLGVCLWEMFAGRRLFKRDTEWETMTAVVSGPMHPPSTVRGVPPSKLDKIILRALERDPSKRFATAEELATRLELFVNAGQKPDTTKMITGLMDQLYGPDAREEQGLIAQLTARGASAEDLATLRRLSGLSIKPSELREITLAGAPEGLKELDTFGADRTDGGENTGPSSVGPAAIHRAVDKMKKEARREPKRRADRGTTADRPNKASFLRRYGPYLAVALLLTATGAVVFLALSQQVEVAAPPIEEPALVEEAVDPQEPLRLDPIEVEIPVEPPPRAPKPIEKILGDLERQGLTIAIERERLLIAAGNADPVRVSLDAEVQTVRTDRVQGFLLISKAPGLPSVVWVGGQTNTAWSARAISINDCPAIARPQPSGIEVSYGSTRIVLPYGGGVLETMKIAIPQGANRLEIDALALAFGAESPSRGAISCASGWSSDGVRLERLPPGKYRLRWMGEGFERSETLIVPSKRRSVSPR